MKTCKICKQTKQYSEFNPSSVYNGKQYYRGECKSCNALLQRTPAAKARVKKYRSSDKYKETRANLRKTEKHLETQREYENGRRDRDNLYRLKKNLRDRVRKALKAQGITKGGSFKDCIGCTKETFKEHVEKQFKEGMTWDNYGFGPGKWVLDHIKPLSLAKTSEEMYDLANYKNIQPLWHEENQLKSDKI